jgi:hypothetical protein
MLMTDVSSFKESSPAPKPQRSPSAIRMARLRARREFGYRCLLIEIHAADVDALVRRGLVNRLRRDDPAAVKAAIEAVLERL